MKSFLQLCEMLGDAPDFGQETKNNSDVVRKLRELITYLYDTNFALLMEFLFNWLYDGRIRQYQGENLQILEGYEKLSSAELAGIGNDVVEQGLGGFEEVAANIVNRIVATILSHRDGNTMGVVRNACAIFSWVSLLGNDLSEFIKLAQEFLKSHAWDYQRKISKDVYIPPHLSQTLQAIRQAIHPNLSDKEVQIIIQEIYQLMDEFKHYGVENIDELKIGEEIIKNLRIKNLTYVNMLLSRLEGALAKETT